MSFAKGGSELIDDVSEPAVEFNLGVEHVLNDFRHERTRGEES